MTIKLSEKTLEALDGICSSPDSGEWDSLRMKLELEVYRNIGSESFELNYSYIKGSVEEIMGNIRVK